MRSRSTCAWRSLASILRERRLGAQALRLQRIGLPLRLIEVFQRCLHGGFLLMQLGRVLLIILNSAPAVLRQLLVAPSLLLREHERGLRPVKLCLACADLRLLNGDLRVDVLHARLRLLHCRLGLTDGDRIVGGVDHHQKIALVDVSVIDDMQFDNAPRDLGRHRDDIGAHGGIASPR